MKVRFSALILVLLACGCHTSAPESATPTVASTDTPPLVPSVQSIPTSPTPTGSPSASAQNPPTQDAGAATVAFLRTLSRTIAQKRNLDAKADKIYTQSSVLPQQRQSADANSGKQPKTRAIRSGADLFTQTVIEQELKTGALLSTLTQVSTPPDCENLLNRYRELLQTQAAHNRHLAEVVQNREWNRGIGTQAGPTTAENDQYQTERTQKVEAVNQEIERVRNISPDIAAKVPPFRVE